MGLKQLAVGRAGYDLDMTENDETPHEDKAQEESGPADEGPSFGERPDNPQPGHPVGETQPIGGMAPRVHEEPQDIPPPPRDETEEESTETPGSHPNAESG
jgi:hypothetical protein